MDLKISGRTAVVTGGGSGLGLETAKILDDEGASVMLTDADEAALDKARESTGLEAYVADLSTTPGAETLYRMTGDVDILVHAAPISAPRGDPLKLSDDCFEDAFQSGFMPAVRLARLYGPGMLQKGWGRMVFITGDNAAQPVPEDTAEGIAKGSIASLAKSIAMAHAGKGLLANCVAPALVETPANAAMVRTLAEGRDVSEDAALEAYLDERRPYLALKRFARSDEVAPVVALLASERASFVSGASWRVDAGSIGTISF